MSINNILFPIDNTNSSNKTLEYAIQLAKRNNAKITLLNVVSFPILIGGYEINPTYVVELEQKLAENAEIFVEEISELFTREGLEVNKLTKQGEPKNVITEISNSGDYDLLILGSHGYGEIKGFLIGSVTNYVIHHSNCPTFLIPLD